MVTTWTIRSTPGYRVSHGLFDAQFARDISLKSLGMLRGGSDPDFGHYSLAFGKAWDSELLFSNQVPNICVGASLV